jgi:hypothetical protein
MECEVHLRDQAALSDSSGLRYAREAAIFQPFDSQRIIWHISA